MSLLNADARSPTPKVTMDQQLKTVLVAGHGWPMADPPVINPVDAINRKVPEGFRTLKALHTALRKMGFYNINLKSESRQRAYRHAVVAAQLEIGPWTDVPALMKEMLTPLVPRYHLQGAGRNFSDQWVVSADAPELQVELKVKIALAKPRPKVKE